MLRGSPLNQQRMADDNAMNLAGMLARGRAGTVQQEPNMVERGLSNVKRSFYGDKNLYGNDPINPSVLDSQYVSPEMAEGAVLDLVGGPMTFAGIGSKTANKLALKKAQDLAGQGVDRDKIWNNTGWYQGGDDKWRYEIDDSAMSINPIRKTRSGLPLNEVVEHSELFESYPQTLATRLKLGQEGTGGSYTSGFDKNGLVNRINIGEYTQPGQIPLKARQEIVEKKLAEINQEVLALNAKSKELEYGSQAQKDYQKRYDALKKEFKKVRASVSGDSKGDKYTPDKGLTLHEIQHNLQNLEGFKGGSTYSGGKVSRQNYLNKAGEAEARNVDLRRNWSADKRKKTPPWESLDIPENQLNWDYYR